MIDGEIQLVGGDDGLLPLNQEEQIQLDFLEEDYGHLFIQDGEHLGYIDISDCGCEDPGTLDLTILGAAYRGESAYEIAVRLGFVGTEQEFIDSLVGPESPNAAEATAQANRAEAEADRAFNEANRAETAADLSTTKANQANSSAEAAALSVLDIAGQVSTVFGYVTQANDSASASAASADTALSAADAAEASADAAEIAHQQTVSLHDDVQSILLSAEEASNVAVTMRDQAEGFSQAAAGHKNTALGYVNDAESYAQAASQDRILAAAYRQDSSDFAAASAVSESNASSYASDALTSATASQTSRLAAEVAYDGVSTAASAIVESVQQAEAWADAAGNYAAASETSSISANSSYQAAQDIADLLAGINPTLNYIGEFNHEPTEAELGSEWKQNAFYKNTVNGYSYVLTGTPLEWERYLADGTLYQLTMESSNGTIFRVGQASETTIKARLFKNGAEITDVTPSGYFSWRRVSADSVADALWNALYTAGYKQVTISVDDVNARASFFCDITSPT